MFEASQDTGNEGFSLGRIFSSKLLLLPSVHLHHKKQGTKGIRRETSVGTRTTSSEDIWNEGFSLGRVFAPKLLLVPGMRLQRPVTEEEEIPDGKPEGSLSLENMGFRRGKN